MGDTKGLIFLLVTLGIGAGAATGLYALLGFFNPPKVCDACNSCCPSPNCPVCKVCPPSTGGDAGGEKPPPKDDGYGLGQEKKLVPPTCPVSGQPVTFSEEWIYPQGLMDASKAAGKKPHEFAGELYGACAAQNPTISWSMGGLCRRAMNLWVPCLPAQRHYLKMDVRMKVGESIARGKFILTVTNVGQLELREGDKIIWIQPAHVPGAGAYELLLQKDTNLVLYGPGGPVWATNAKYLSDPPVFLQLEEAGTLTIHKGAGPADDKGVLFTVP